MLKAPRKGRLASNLQGMSVHVSAPRPAVCGSAFGLRPRRDRSAIRPKTRLILDAIHTPRPPIRPTFIDKLCFQPPTTDAHAEFQDGRTKAALANRGAIRSPRIAADDVSARD